MVSQELYRNTLKNPKIIIILSGIDFGIRDKSGARKEMKHISVPKYSRLATDLHLKAWKAFTCDFLLISEVLSILNHMTTESVTHKTK